jgi:hypothetical protein
MNVMIGKSLDGAAARSAMALKTFSRVSVQAPATNRV